MFRKATRVKENGVSFKDPKVVIGAGIVLAILLLLAAPVIGLGAYGVYKVAAYQHGQVQQEVAEQARPQQNVPQDSGIVVQGIPPVVNTRQGPPTMPNESGPRGADFNPVTPQQAWNNAVRGKSKAN